MPVGRDWTDDTVTVTDILVTDVLVTDVLVTDILVTDAIAGCRSVPIPG
jgi:hypothetical protein